MKINSVIFLFALFALTTSAASIRIDPASSVTFVGDTVDLNVRISDVADLYSYQFDLAFDPAILSATGVTEASFLGGGGATVFVPGLINNTAGFITFTVNSLLGPVPGVSGTGGLAAVRFKGRTGGTSAVTLSNVLLLDSAANDITATVENGSVLVSGAEIPEPGSALLSVSAAAGLIWWHKRRKVKQSISANP